MRGLASYTSRLAKVEQHTCIYAMSVLYFFARRPLLQMPPTRPNAMRYTQQERYTCKDASHTGEEISLSLRRYANPRIVHYEPRLAQLED
jgi:hypothetical protein